MESHLLTTCSLMTAQNRRDHTAKHPLWLGKYIPLTLCVCVQRSLFLFVCFETLKCSALYLFLLPCLICGFVSVTGEQRDGDTEWTSFCNGGDSGSETTAGGERWFPTSTKKIQLPATVRHALSSPIFIPSVCISVSLSPSLLCDLSRSPCPFSTSSFDFCQFPSLSFPLICAFSLFFSTLAVVYLFVFKVNHHKDTFS